MLEKTQKADLDITSWIKWFMVSLRRANEDSETTVAKFLTKARFWVRASSMDCYAGGTRADVSESDTVLVTGASGGVGSAVVQLAQARVTPRQS